jgi:hypothetical protein
MLISSFLDQERSPNYHYGIVTQAKTQWVERVETTKSAGTWTDAQTVDLVYLALKQSALIWLDSIKRCGVSTYIWDEFKAAFIQGYVATPTARIAIVTLDVK